MWSVCPVWRAYIQTASHLGDTLLNPDTEPHPSPSSLILQEWCWSPDFQSQSTAWTSLSVFSSSPFSWMYSAKEPAILPAEEIVIALCFFSPSRNLHYLQCSPFCWNQLLLANGWSRDLLSSEHKLVNGLMETINVLLSTIRWMVDQCIILMYWKWFKMIKMLSLKY